MKPPLTVAKLAHQWRPSATENYHMYDPLVVTTWWGLAHLAQVETADIILGGKLNPQIYHAANLLVHWMTACVVLEILRKLRFPLGRQRAERRSLPFIPCKPKPSPGPQQ